MNLIKTKSFLESVDLQHLLPDVSAHAAQFVSDFQHIAFPEGFGFDAFSWHDIDTYLSDPTQWYFSLNKLKGKGILYGRVHTELRRHLLNGLPHEVKMAVCRAKFDAFHVISKLAVILPEDHDYTVDDVADVGMAHSIYHIHLTLGDGQKTSVVIKQEEWASQSFFSHLLGELGWPHYKTGHVKDDFGCWEISEYLGDVGLYQGFVSASPCDRLSLLTQLAEHAALGDVLGRGDRHFENYLCKGNTIYPIDISYLFWQGNDEWVWKYVAGGMTEYNVLLLAESDTERAKWRDLFWTTYKDTLTFLSDKRSVIRAQIAKYFGEKEPDTARKCDFVDAHVTDISSVITAKKELYDDAFSEMQHRYNAKLALASAIKSDASILGSYPTLKMYYYADKDRLSTFYLAEDHTDLDLNSLI